MAWSIRASRSAPPVLMDLLARLPDAIDGSDKLTAGERANLHGKLVAKRSLKRFLRTTKNWLLRIDRAAVAAAAHLDGECLLRTSDWTSPASVRVPTGKVVPPLG